MKFRKKPIVIEAIQWTGDNFDELKDFTETDNQQTVCRIVKGTFDRDLFVDTLEGSLMASLNDWIIKGIKGEFYPCKPDIFEATYDLVKEEES